MGVIDETTRYWELLTRFAIIAFWHLVASKEVAARFCPCDKIDAEVAPFLATSIVVFVRFCPSVNIANDVAPFFAMSKSVFVRFAHVA